MKSFTKINLMSGILILALVLLSCSTEQVPVSSGSDEYNNIPEFTLADIDIISTEFKDATIEKDMVYPSDMAIRDQHRRCDVHLGEILRQLSLDEHQKELLHQALREYHDCVKHIRERALDEMREILSDAREGRHRILAHLRSGGITPERARELLRELNTEIHNRIAELRVHICLALKDCRSELFRKIYNLLTDEQQTMFARWVHSLPDCPCERIQNDTE